MCASSGQDPSRRARRAPARLRLKKASSFSWGIVSTSGSNQAVSPRHRSLRALSDCRISIVLASFALEVRLLGRVGREAGYLAAEVPEQVQPLFEIAARTPEGALERRDVGDPLFEVCFEAGPRRVGGVEGSQVPLVALGHLGRVFRIGGERGQEKRRGEQGDNGFRVIGFPLFGVGPDRHPLPKR